MIMIPSARGKVKVVMTTALDDPRTVMKALYESDADSYLVKPIRMQALDPELRAIRLISWKKYTEDGHLLSGL